MSIYPSKNRLIESLISGVFLSALFIPCILWLVQQDVNRSDAEKRVLQPFPVLAEQQSITGFTRAFDSYFKDHFGLRSQLINRYQREMRKRFGMSGVAHVINGIDGWMFLTGEGMLEDLQGKLRFSSEDEQRFWLLLGQKKEWLNSRGYEYVFMVAPNKQSIYPEYHPRYYAQSQQESRFEQLLTGKPIRSRSNGVLLDLRPILRENKQAHRLYHKTDTHWNYRGAYQAYHGLMAQIQTLFPEEQIGSRFTFTTLQKKNYGGDLAVMSGQHKSVREQSPIIDITGFTTLHGHSMGREFQQFFDVRQLKPFRTNKIGKPLRVLVLHDSFFNHLKPFVSESFAQVLYVWQYYDESTMAFFTEEKLARLLAMYQPDLVIEETVERYLPRFLKVNDYAW